MLILEIFEKQTPDFKIDVFKNKSSYEDGQPCWEYRFDVDRTSSQKITEIFDAKANDWEYDDDNETYIIDINDEEQIFLNFVQNNKYASKIFDVEFASFINGNPNYGGYTNSHMSIKIFSNIAECIRDFYKKENPDGFRLSSKITDNTRTNLYYKLAKKIADNINGNVYIDDDNQYRHYLVSKIDK